MSDYHEQRNVEVSRRTEGRGADKEPAASLQVFTHKHNGKPCSGEMVDLAEGRFCIQAGARVYSGEMIK